MNIRATFSFSEGTAKQLNELYIAHLQNSDKKTRSALVAEAIKLLWDKQNGNGEDHTRCQRIYMQAFAGKHQDI